MSKIKIIPVDTKKAMDDYIALPHRLYKGCAEYVPELDMDTRNFFNPKHNDSLKYADVQSFVAYRDGECVGRITGVISHKTNAKWNVRRVRFTNIEFYDSLDISSALLNAVEQWGKEKGMEAIEGPMGITDFDKEGMLMEDYELGGSAAEFWNYPYYAQHMEKLGYTKAVDWLQVRINVPKEIPARYHRVSEYLKEELHLRVIKKTKKEVKAGYGHVLFDLFNEAFAPLYGTSVFDYNQVDDYINMYLPLLDMDLIPFIVNEKDELVGAAVTLRDPSDGLRKSKGKLLPFGWLHLMKHIYINKSEKAMLLLIGVKPELHGMGLNAMFFDDLIPIYNKKGIKWCETNPQLEYNVKELAQWKPLNPQIVKRRRCWEKSLTDKPLAPNTMIKNLANE